MHITLDKRPMSTKSFGVFHTSMGSNLCTESELKGDLSVGGSFSSEYQDLDPTGSTHRWD
jgi:hypothetical protein